MFPFLVLHVFPSLVLTHSGVFPCGSGALLPLSRLHVAPLSVCFLTTRSSIILLVFSYNFQKSILTRFWSQIFYFAKTWQNYASCDLDKAKKHIAKLKKIHFHINNNVSESYFPNKKPKQILTQFSITTTPCTTMQVCRHLCRSFADQPISGYL